MTGRIIEPLTKTSEEDPAEMALDISYHSPIANEKLIVILNKNSGLAPYAHEFSKSNLDPQIISGFISAMATFMGFVMGGQQASWKTEYGSESMLLVEHGTWAIGVLLVSRETTESRSRLRRIIHEFEDYFAVLRDSDGIEGSALRDFDQYVRRTLVNDQITSRTIVIRSPEWRNSHFAFDLPSTSYVVSKILMGLDNPKKVKEIAEAQNISLDVAIDLISQAYWYNTVFLKYIPPEDEILVLSDRSSTILFQKDNPLGLSDASLYIVARLDGRASLFQLTEGLNAQDLEILQDELGMLVNRGFIQRISPEQRQVLQDESVLSSLVCEGMRAIGNKKTREIFETIRRSRGNQYPRIYRITLTDRMHVHCIFDENMTSCDLKDLVEVLELFIKELGIRLTTGHNKRVIGRLRFKFGSH